MASKQNRSLKINEGHLTEISKVLHQQQYRTKSQQVLTLAALKRARENSPGMMTSGKPSLRAIQVCFVTRSGCSSRIWQKTAFTSD